MARRRPRGRPPRLMEPDVHKKLVEATRTGTPVELAAQYAGVSPRAFQEWLARGRDEAENIADGAEPKATEEPYLRLWDEVSQARATAAVHSVQAIRRAVQGGFIIEETTKRYRNEDGQMVEETTVKRTSPDWRAGAWYLERQASGHFGKAAERVEVTGSGGGPVELTASKASELAARVFGNIGAITAATKPDEGDVVDAEVVDDD